MIWRPRERQPKKGWSMKFGMAVMAVFASLAIINASAAAAYAAQRGSTPTGSDVSYPQCGKKLPLGQAFGIVGVNDGLANTTNPCLATEITWAQTSSGTTSQPKASLYVNTANPGNLGVADWPTNNSDPVTGNPVTDPYGTCAGADNQACAWQYGWNIADLDAQTRGVSSPGNYQWWLDVETVNSWEPSTQNNRADLEGMVAYFHGIGSTAGIYSTTRQWGQIAGTVPSASPLYPLPNWIPGARTLSQARTNCGSAPLTGGGIVTVTQWTTWSANNDFSCR
jgi:hypothetical protein